MDENLAALDAALDELNAAIAYGKPAPVREMKVIPLNDQTNQKAAPEVEVTVSIRNLDYEFVVNCLNTARELLAGGNSADTPQARIEIDWALVGLGQDIPA
jgi:hypothetical protein